MHSSAALASGSRHGRCTQSLPHACCERKQTELRENRKLVHKVKCRSLTKIKSVLVIVFINGRKCAVFFRCSKNAADENFDENLFSLTKLTLIKSFVLYMCILCSRILFFKLSVKIKNMVLNIYIFSLWIQIAPQRGPILLSHFFFFFKYLGIGCNSNCVQSAIRCPFSCLIVGSR